VFEVGGKIMSFSPTQLFQYAQQYAPYVHLFPYADPQYNFPVYDPCSVDWYLARVQLLGSGGTPLGPPLSEANLANQPSSSYLQIPDPNATSPYRAGDAASAVAYVHIFETPGTTGGASYDLQYWFFYAVRGMSTIRFVLGPAYMWGDMIVTDGDTSTPPYLGLGEHQGDWKTATVRISGSSGRILGVFFGQHNSGVWCLPNEYETMQGRQDNAPRPVVYSARNTHSCFSHEGQFSQIGFDYVAETSILGFDIGIGGSLLEWTDGSRPAWDCKQGLVLAADDTDPTFTPPAWVTFAGGWGPVYKQNIVEGVQNGATNLVLPADPPSWVASLLHNAEVMTGFEAALEAFFGSHEETGAATPYNQGMWKQGPGPLPSATLPSSAEPPYQTSPYGAAFAATPAGLFVGWIGQDKSLNTWLSATGVFSLSIQPYKNTWPQQSSNNFAMTYFATEEQTYVAWTGVSDQSINIQGTTDGSHFRTKSTLGSFKSSYAPAITSYVATNGTPAVCVAWAQKGADAFYLMVSAGASFDDQQPYITVPALSATGLALVFFQNELRLVWVDATSGAIQITSSATGGFQDSRTISFPHTSTATPAAVEFQGQLYLAWFANGTIQVWSSSDGFFTPPSSSDPGTQGPLISMPQWPIGATPINATPALASFNGLLYLAWIDNEQAIHVMTSDDGVYFY